MADMKSASSGSSEVSTSGGTEQEEIQDVVKEKDTVSYETYRKVLSEKKKLMEVRDEHEKLKAEVKSQHEARLKEQGDYKSIAEQYKAENEKIKNDLVKERQNKEDSLKLGALLEAIPGNVPRKAWGLLDLDKIVIDPSTGHPDELSLQKAAKHFVDTFPELIQKTNGIKTSSEAPRKIGVDPGGPQTTLELAQRIVALRHKQ